MNQKYTELINEYIIRFGQKISDATGADIKFASLDNDGFTSVSRGSATVGINVNAETGVIVLISQIMKVPQKKADECTRLLLELNFSAMSGAAFAIDKKRDTICIKYQRDIFNLDYDEFEDMLHSVATLADEWDDRLMQMFADN
jgi:hypothetical protein